VLAAAPFFAGEAERSGKRGDCAAFNEALPVQQRLETLHKVCALAFAFSTAHIQRAPLHSAQRCTARSATQRAALHSAQRFTAPSASLRKALHSAQHCTPPPPLQRCTARSITQRPALHCTEHSEPRQGRSQQANQAYTSGGIFLSAFNGCCAQTVRVRVSLANSRTRALLFFSGSLTACDMDLCILEVLHTTML